MSGNVFLFKFGLFVGANLYSYRFRDNVRFHWFILVLLLLPGTGILFCRCWLLCRVLVFSGDLLVSFNLGLLLFLLLLRFS